MSIYIPFGNDCYFKSDKVLHKGSLNLNKFAMAKSTLVTHYLFKVLLNSIQNNHIEDFCFTKLLKRTKVFKYCEEYLPGANSEYSYRFTSPSNNRTMTMFWHLFGNFKWVHVYWLAHFMFEVRNKSTRLLHWTC